MIVGAVTTGSQLFKATKHCTVMSITTCKEVKIGLTYPAACLGETYFYDDYFGTCQAWVTDKPGRYRAFQRVRLRYQGSSIHSYQVVLATTRHSLEATPLLSHVHY